MSAQESMTPMRSMRGKDGSKSKRGVFVVEKRAHPRFTVELPFDYSPIDGAEEHGGVTSNISEGGLLACLPETIERGAFLKIVMLFLKGSELITIKVTAKVVWCDLAAKAVWGEHRYGLEFQSFNRGALEKLKILLKKVSEIHPQLK